MVKSKSIIFNKDITLLITAAGFVKSACNYKLSIEDPSFLNIGSTLAVEEIKKKFNLKIILAVNKKDLYIHKFYPYNDMEIIEIGKTKSITETIEKSLIYIKTEWCLINPITTIPYINEFNFPFIEFGSELLPKENWSSVIFNKENNPIFLNKFDKKSECQLSYPFTGRIFSRKKDIHFTIKKLNDFEKKDLIYLAENLFKFSNIKIRYCEWLDIGHLATYPITRTSSINSRFFNTLIFDKKKNVIKKKSTNTKKIEDEICFYKNMPNQIKRYFPMILNSKKESSESSYEMEYIGKPNLSEIYLFSKIGPNAIIRIFNNVELIFKTFYEVKPYTIEKVKWLYSSKTKSRESDLKAIIQKKEFSFLRQIYFEDFVINNIKFPSLRQNFSFLKNNLCSFEDNQTLHFGHGDLCFNNMLVDHLYGTVRLIDPKGEKHKKLKIYGLINKFYDLSKLNHSIEGLYDSIVNNLFRLKVIDKNNIEFEVYKPFEYDYYNNYFREIISDKRINYSILRMLTANLFFTMLPFHLDNQQRIISFALLGSIFMSKYSMEDILL